MPNMVSNNTWQSALADPKKSKAIFSKKKQAHNKRIAKSIELPELRVFGSSFFKKRYFEMSLCNLQHFSSPKNPLFL